MRDIKKVAKVFFRNGCPNETGEKKSQEIDESGVRQYAQILGEG